MLFSLSYCLLTKIHFSYLLSALIHDFRVIMELQVLVEKMDQRDQRVKLDP